MAEEKFHVYFIYPDGTNTREREWVSAEEAVTFAHQATRRPAALIGILAEVMITDDGDCCVFHWKFGQGIVFPTREELKESANKPQ